MNINEMIENAKTIEQPMSMDELYGEIINLLLKYSSGTGVNELSVEEFKIISALISNIIRNPKQIL